MKRSLLMLALLGASCGKTVFSTERFACNTTGECADGFVCSAGECRTMSVLDAGVDAGPPVGTDGGAGAGCTDPSDCDAALTCVDGVCCLTACDSPCDSCNQAGSEGTCLVRPAGSAAPSCGGYACDGLSADCSTACDPGAGVNTCNPDFTCVSTTCGRCWSAVKTDFNQPGDSAWVLSSDADITGGVLNVAVTSRNGMSSETTALSSETLPLVGCGVTFELATAPGVVAGYTGRVGLRGAGVSQRPAFVFQFDTRGVVASWGLSDGGVGEQVVVPAGTAPPRWLRLEEAGGQVLWRGTGGTTFTTLHSLAHDETLTGMRVELAGRFPAQGGNQRVSFSISSLNRGP